MTVTMETDPRLFSASHTYSPLYSAVTSRMVSDPSSSKTIFSSSPVTSSPPRYHLNNVKSQI